MLLLSGVLIADLRRCCFPALDFLCQAIHYSARSIRRAVIHGNDLYRHSNYAEQRTQGRFNRLLLIASRHQRTAGPLVDELDIAEIDSFLDDIADLLLPERDLA